LGTKNIHRALIVLAAALSVSNPGQAAATAAADKDYHFPEVRIAVQVESDGTFQVEERRTYDFRGSFRWADLSIPLGFERKGAGGVIAIEDFTVSDEGGQALPCEVSRSGAEFKAKWSYQASDEQKTFVFRYKVRYGIISYPDVSELYWKAIGSGWSKATDAAEVTVTLPQALASPQDMLVYGHGPLSGISEIVDARTARFTASGIPAGQSLEIRVVWPAGLVAGIPGQGMDKAAIMAEEAGFVQDTIRDAAASQDRAARKARTVKTAILAWLGWWLVGSLAFLAFYVPLWKKIGREYPIPSAPEYFHEPPSELSPALVESLRTQGGGPSPRAFTAVIFDLARRGFIRVEDKQVEKSGLFGPKMKEETILTLVDLEPRSAARRGGALLPLERSVLEVVFGEAGGGRVKPGDSLTLGDLKDWLRKKSVEFQKWFKAWKKEIKAEADQRGFLEAGTEKQRKTMGVASIPIGLLTMNIPLVILAGALVPKLARRTMAWAEEDAKWKGLEKFIKDFGEFKDLPPQAYVLWESYLVYGILFGHASKILKALPVILQDQRAPSPHWYPGLSAANLAGIASFAKGIESTANAIQAASTQASHYSSGGGGGFSGGGGGGAGGGGGGAG
jgi:uncharacterized membrane protein